MPVGLANQAGPDGPGAFPSVATLVRYPGLSERTVRSCLRADVPVHMRVYGVGQVAPGVALFRRRWAGEGNGGLPTP